MKLRLLIKSVYIFLMNHIVGHTHYPVVPGHELAGVVTAVGSKVTGFKVQV